MPKRISAYQKFVEKLSERLDKSGEVSHEELSKMIDTTQEYLHAAEDLTKEEWQLIANYVRRDLSDWRQDYRRSYDASPSMRMLSDTIWHWLAKISDTTVIEWHELMGDLEHQGQYVCGELVGLGVMQCTECGHLQEIWHPTLLEKCPECENKRFTRLSLSTLLEVEQQHQ